MKCRFFKLILVKMCILTLGLAGLLGVLTKTSFAATVQFGACTKGVNYEVFSMKVDENTIKYQIVFKEMKNAKVFEFSDIVHGNVFKAKIYQKSEERCGKLMLIKPVVQKSQSCLEFEINRDDLQFNGSATMPVEVEIVSVCVDEKTKQETEEFVVLLKLCLQDGSCLKEQVEYYHSDMPNSTEQTTTADVLIVKMFEKIKTNNVFVLQCHLFLKTIVLGLLI